VGLGREEDRELRLGADELERRERIRAVERLEIAIEEVAGRHGPKVA
jgi:hypothetical protein